MKISTVAKVIGGLLAGSIVALLLLRWGVSWWMHERPFSTARFDRAQWMAGNRSNDDRDCIRGAMAKDILRTIATPGASRTDVESQLGPADRVHENMAHYDLGMCSGLRVDYDNLDIKYIDGKVAQAGHSQS